MLLSLLFALDDDEGFSSAHVAVRKGTGGAKPELRPHQRPLLALDFLEPFGLSQYRLAKDIGVPARRINEIVHGTRAVSADTALRLARYFGTSDRFWLNLQARYDLEVERDHKGAKLEKEVPIPDRAS